MSETRREEGNAESAGERRAIATEAAPAAIGPYSQALLVGDTLYCSGQIALDPETAVLEGAEMGFEDVVKVTIYVTDLSDFAELNAIYAEHFIEPYPARATIEASGLPKDAQVEMDLVAVRRRGRPS